MEHGTTPARYLDTMAKLTLALEDGQEVIVPLSERLTLGRSDDNDVVVNDERLSLQHAEVLPHASGSYEVRDLGSTSGTFVNDQRVQTCRLMQGDRLAFGPLTAVLDLEASAIEDKSASSAEAIASAEERLTYWQAAARQSEAAHEQWLTAIADLTRQHDEKATALRQLGTDITTAQEKLTALATQQQNETARLDKLQRDCAHAETRLSALRQQIAELDLHLQDGHARLAAQNEDISAAENTLTRLEQRRSQLKTSLQALTDTEDKLTHTQGRLQEAETRHATLTASITALAQEQQQRESSLSQLLAEFHSSETHLNTCRRELATETRLLEDTQRRRTELEKQCETLAAQQRVAESVPLSSKPPLPGSVPAARNPRIVAIDSPRFTIIPMKSERVVKRSSDAPPRKGT